MNTSEDLRREELREEIRKQVVRRMRARTGFTWHLAIFVLANLALFAINQRFSPGVQWYVWPLFAWGAGLFMHGFALFNGTQREAALEAEVERELARRLGSR